MRKGTIILLVFLIALLMVGVFYRNYTLDKNSGEQDGLRMGYLHGFNNARDGKAPNTEDLRERLFVMGDSTYDKAFLVGARKGYLKGYDAGKGGD